MGTTTFETEPSVLSCGYCQFHGGFIRRVNIENRGCVEKGCRFVILFTKHPDAEEFAKARVQKFHGNPYRFMELYGDLIKRPEAKDEADEPGEHFIIPNFEFDGLQAKIRKGAARKKPPKPKAWQFHKVKDERKAQKWNGGST